MTFKEAFEHYKAGIATPEETAYVEQELEKNQLISEYLEDDFDVDLEPEATTSEELKKVKKSIRTRTRNIIIISVAIVVALALVTHYVAAPTINQSYYNPMTKEYTDCFYDIDISLSAFTELQQAGYYHVNSIIDNTDIGKYAITLVRYDFALEKDEYLTASLDKNTLTIPYSFWASSLPLNIFARASYPVYDMDSENKAYYIKELEELPDYMSVTAAVSFSEDLTMDQLLDMMGSSKVTFLWAGIRNAPEDDQLYPLCGMDLTAAGGIIEHINDSYPAFELALCSNDSNYSASNYETHFKSLLQYSIDHPDFLNAIDTDKDYVSYYQSVLDYVKENGVKTYGVLVKGTSAEILTLMNNSVVSQIWPLDADINF